MAGSSKQQRLDRVERPAPCPPAGRGCRRAAAPSASSAARSDADQPPGLAAGQLRDVRVLLLRHDRRPGREGVVQSRPSRTPAVAQSTISSPSRDRCTPISAATNRNSATKSRSLTASIEFGAGRVEARAPRRPPPGRAAATSRPARPSPAGRPRSAGPSRAAGRRRGPAPARARAAGARTAPAGRAAGGSCPAPATPDVLLGLADQRRLSSATSRARSPRWSRRYSRRSVATWSLRLRPARSLPPSGAEPFEQAALQRGVHVLVGDGRPERPRPARLVELVERARASAPARRPSAARPGAAPARAPATPAGRTARAASRSARSPTARRARPPGRPRNAPPHSRGGACSLRASFRLLPVTTAIAHDCRLR